jgi:hypothetical protein
VRRIKARVDVYLTPFRYMRPVRLVTTLDFVYDH